jgi:hypothetical protein
MFVMVISIECGFTGHDGYEIISLEKVNVQLQYNLIYVCFLFF